VNCNYKIELKLILSYHDYPMKLISVKIGHQWASL